SCGEQEVTGLYLSERDCGAVLPPAECGPGDADARSGVGSEDQAGAVVGIRPGGAPLIGLADLAQRELYGRRYGAGRGWDGVARSPGQDLVDVGPRVVVAEDRLSHPGRSA